MGMANMKWVALGAFLGGPVMSLVTGTPLWIGFTAMFVSAGVFAILREIVE